MDIYDLSGTYSSAAEGFRAQARRTLAASLARIEHGLNQLSEEDIWWRPHAQQNAIGNLILHLSGNISQWIIAAVEGLPDSRNRPAEFSQRQPIAKDQLVAKLRAAVANADRAIASVTEARLLEKRRVQGMDTTVLTAIFHSVTHFEGHAQEIIYITRLRLGERYVFQWKPATPEQGAAKV